MIRLYLPVLTQINLKSNPNPNHGLAHVIVLDLNLALDGYVYFFYKIIRQMPFLYRVDFTGTCKLDE